MYYFDRADGLKSIPGKTESANERSELEALCNAYWDMRNPAEPRRRAAHHQAKIVWDWAMIGIVLECSFEPLCRDLFVELLNDSNLELRRRMASKITRLEGDAFDTILPALIGNSGAQVRRTAYKLVERISSDDATVFESWRNAIATWLSSEADADNRSYLTFAHKRLTSQIGRAAKQRPSLPRNTQLHDDILKPFYWNANLVEHQQVKLAQIQYCIRWCYSACSNAVIVSVNCVVVCIVCILHFLDVLTLHANRCIANREAQFDRCLRARYLRYEVVVLLCSLSQPRRSRRASKRGRKVRVEKVCHFAE